MNKIIITNSLIAEMSPCSYRFENYLKFYGGKEHSLNDFLALENITYTDKIWVARRVLPINILIKWSVKCAYSVINIYNKKYPNDSRVSDCLNYLKSIKDFTKITTEQREEILRLRHNAAYAAADAAYAAVSAAAYAAVSAVSAAAYAASAVSAAAYAASAACDAADAAYAAVSAAAYAAVSAVSAAAYAAYAAGASADARAKQQELNIKLLKETIEESNK